jgi:hypothetical protein
MDEQHGEQGADFQAGHRDRRASAIHAATGPKTPKNMQAR